MKKHFKFAVIFLMVLLMTATLFACGNNSTDNGTPITADEALTVLKTAVTKDLTAYTLTGEFDSENYKAAVVLKRSGNEAVINTEYIVESITNLEKAYYKDGFHYINSDGGQRKTKKETSVVEFEMSIATVMFYTYSVWNDFFEDTSITFEKTEAVKKSDGSYIIETEMKYTGDSTLTFTFEINGDGYLTKYSSTTDNLPVNNEMQEFTTTVVYTLATPSLSFPDDLNTYTLAA